VKSKIAFVTLAAGVAVLLWWAGRARQTNLAFTERIPRPHFQTARRFKVFSSDLFSLRVQLPSESPTPHRARPIRCNLTLRILDASGRVITDQSIVELFPELFPYAADSRALRTLHSGEPFALSPGLYRVELANHSNTPTPVLLRGAELILEPFNSDRSVAVTRLLLFSGSALTAMGLVVALIANRRFVDSRRDAT